MSNIFMGCCRDYDNGNYDTPTLELTFAPFAFTEAALLTGPTLKAICGAFVPWDGVQERVAVYAALWVGGQDCLV